MKSKDQKLLAFWGGLFGPLRDVGLAAGLQLGYGELLWWVSTKASAVEIVLAIL